LNLLTASHLSIWKSIILFKKYQYIFKTYNKRILKAEFLIVTLYYKVLLNEISL